MGRRRDFRAARRSALLTRGQCQSVGEAVRVSIVDQPIAIVVQPITAAALGLLRGSADLDLGAVDARRHLWWWI